jgi:hypothetical protein
MTLNLASRWTAAFCAAFFSFQPALTQAQSDVPWLGLVAEVEHTEGELAGMTTYRLYLYTPNTDDLVVSCSGDDDNPLYIMSTSEPAWFQHEVPTTPFATDINPKFISIWPELAYDSWLTIGAEDNTPPTAAIISVPPNGAFEEFEMGENIEVNDELGAAWFVLPTAGDQAVSGEDLRVLVAQLTTAGEISGQIQCQVFLNGSNQDEFREVLPILTACNDPEALNYEPLSFSADGCEYSEVDRVLDLVTTHELEAFPSPATTVATITFPAHLGARLVGAELRATGLDGRLVGSWPIQSTVERIDVSGLAAGQYVLTVAGFQDATIRFQGDLVVTK